MFLFIFKNKQNAGVFKLLINIEKSAWLKACSCTLTGASSWLLVHYLNFFAGILQGRGLWKHWTLQAPAPKLTNSDKVKWG